MPTALRNALNLVRCGVASGAILLSNPLGAQSMDDVADALASENVDGAMAAFDAFVASGSATSDDFRTFSSRLFRLERSSEAIAVLERGLQSFPDATRFHFMIGTMHRNEGRCTEAIRPLERYTSAQTDDPDGWAALASCYERTGQTGQAIAALERYIATETRADRAEARAGAQVHLEELRSGGAVAAAAPVVETPPVAAAPQALSPVVAGGDSPFAALDGAPAAAAPADQQRDPAVAEPAPESPAAPALVAAPPSAPGGQDPTPTRAATSYADVDAAITAGDAAAAARDWETARVAWDAATALDPTRLEAWYRAGVGAAVLGDAERAAQAFRQAQALDPSWSFAGARAAQAEARAEHEASIALDRPGYHTDPGVRAEATLEAVAANRYLDTVRASLGSDTELDPLLVALRARIEGDADVLGDVGLGVVAVAPTDASRFVEAADALRIAGDLDTAAWLLDLYEQIGGEASDRFVAVRAAVGRASASR